MWSDKITQKTAIELFKGTSVTKRANRKMVAIMYLVLTWYS